MEDEKTFSKKTLQQCSYRYLQQIAKSMSLPCNVKKFYLIELIRAKKFNSENEVKSIIQRVKLERQHLAQVRKSIKAHSKSVEVFSLKIKNTQSPAITETPKRSRDSLLRCSPEQRRTIYNYRPKQILTQKANGSPKTQNGSDRVLRSFNLKTFTKNSGVFNVDSSVLGVVEARCRNSPKFEIVRRDGNVPQFNMSTKCFVTKYNPIQQGSNSFDVNTYEDRSVCNGNSSQSAKRQRTLSGIYPLVHQETSKFGYLQTIGLRGKDGKMSKIHALVQKRTMYKANCGVLKISNPEISLNDIINCKIDAQNLAHSNIMELVVADANINNNYLQLQYPPLPSLEANHESQIQNNVEVSDVLNIIEDDLPGNLRSGCYKKIMDMDRCNRVGSNRQQDEKLPKISDAFTMFNDATQPLYIDVCNESDRSVNHPVTKNNSTMGILESFYNFRNQFLINEPLQQITTTSNTKCVYSTPTMVTAKTRPSATLTSEQCTASQEVDIQYKNSFDSDLPYLSEFLKIPRPSTNRYDNTYNEDLSTSRSSLDMLQSQGLGACVTIPEMVEDALEIISQDGDYMERIGMDIRVNCVLCPWAGPKIILESHIRKEHVNQIFKQSKNEWNVTFTLGSLVQCPLWLSHIIEYDSILYILSAKYEDPDCFMATLSTLTPEPILNRLGSITLYNKITGEPYLWEGVIHPLPSNLPYHNESHCLKLELSRLDLLPNSANLKLINRELVTNSPKKAVVGHPELNDIHIILFIKVLDCNI